MVALVSRPSTVPSGAQIMYTVNIGTDHLAISRAELQLRSLNVLEKRSLKCLLWVGNLYQSSSTLGLEPVSIVHYTRPGSSIKQPSPN